MTFVVTEPCIGCKHTDCVTVCPVDCFREGANFLVIDPDECVDCGLCEVECPIEAIVPEAELPAGQLYLARLNAELALKWPPLTKKLAALPDASDWAARSDKLAMLIR